MGIRGLTRFVDTLPCCEDGVWEYNELCDTNLIIDGCGLYYYIYASNDLNMKYGGQYEQLQDRVKEFVSKLQSNNVVPYVVIDGIMARDEKKFDTYVRRKQDYVKRMKTLWTSRMHTGEMVIPRLVETAFVQVLQELGVKYAVADFEADCEIASLANELDAPVISNDSDFYIFKVKHGYIPFQQYDFSGGSIRVKKFKFHGFAKYLHLKASMLPLLASLIGNDYVSDTMLQPFMAYLEQPRHKIPAIANFLSEHKSASGAFKAAVKSIPSHFQPEFQQALQLSLEEYQAKESNLLGYFNSGDLGCNIVTFNNHSLPRWAVELFRNESIAAEGFACLCNRKIFLRPQCEDTSLPSAQVCVQDLRWYYYALVLHFENASSRRLRQPESKASAQTLVTDSLTKLEKVFDHTHESRCIRNLHTTDYFNTQSSSISTHSTIDEDNTDLAEMMAEFQFQDNTVTHFQDSPTYHQDVSSRLDCTNRDTNFSKEITVAEFDREGSTLVTRKINLAPIVSKTNVQIDDIQEMSDDARKRHLLKLLDSDLPSIHDLPIKHQLSVSALRYWIIHCNNIKKKQLAALLVHYVGEKPSPLRQNKSLPDVSIRTVHGFSQWQNVVYWTEKLNLLFSAPFPHMQVAELYNGIQVCLVYDRLNIAGIKLAESIVINANLYRQLYDVITNDIPRDCRFNQPRMKEKPAKDEGRKPRCGERKKIETKDYLKGNKFAVFSEESDSDEL